MQDKRIKYNMHYYDTALYNDLKKLIQENTDIKEVSLYEAIIRIGIREIRNGGGYSKWKESSIQIDG